MNNDLYNHDWINIDGNSIHKTAIIHPNVKLGKGNTIGAYCVIGSNGEVRGVSQNDFKGHVVIGNNNVISEFVSIQRPFNEGETTEIGSNNIIMRGVHFGHNSVIGDNCEICTGVILGGYVVVGSNTKIKLGVTVRNRVVVGQNSIIGLGSAVVSNVKDGVVVYGVPAKEQCQTKHLDQNKSYP
jgi:UDP-N-acetylglucosamine acyltransferase